MKKDIHPKVRDVVFKDSASGAMFITQSTAKSTETVDMDGTTYPLIIVEVSSMSHPFYTGQSNIQRSAGQVARFKKMAERAQKTKEARKAVKSKEEKAKQRREKATKAEAPKAKPARKKTSAKKTRTKKAIA
jgi:large subunit ribosomal protein L31